MTARPSPLEFPSARWSVPRSRGAGVARCALRLVGLAEGSRRLVPIPLTLDQGTPLCRRRHVSRVSLLPLQGCWPNREGGCVAQVVEMSARPVPRPGSGVVNVIRRLRGEERAPIASRWNDLGRETLGGG
jgi:hypothetical protein